MFIVYAQLLRVSIQENGPYFVYVRSDFCCMSKNEPSGLCLINILLQIYLNDATFTFFKLLARQFSLTAVRSQNHPNHTCDCTYSISMS